VAFIRKRIANTKHFGQRTYYQVVENYREGEKVKQRVLLSMGINDSPVELLREVEEILVGLEMANRQIGAGMKGWSRRMVRRGRKDNNRKLLLTHIELYRERVKVLREVVAKDVALVRDAFPPQENVYGFGTHLLKLPTYLHWFINTARDVEARQAVVANLEHYTPPIKDHFCHHKKDEAHDHLRAVLERR
jgi:hypothetical protein